MSDLLEVAPSAPVKVSAADIKAALLKHYAPPSHRVFFEVSNDTGARSKRWIDALAVGIWPSTGHEIVGIEIKISRGDWLREMKQPAKAQELMRFCTRWYLACPAGMIKADELPATWGMLAYKDGAMRQAVVGKLLDPEPITPGFMMAVVRHSNGVDRDLVESIVRERLVEREKEIAKRYAYEEQRRRAAEQSRREDAIVVAERLVEMTGEEVNRWEFDPVALAAAYKLMKSTGLHKEYGAVTHSIDSMERAIAALKKIQENPVLDEVRKADALFNKRRLDLAKRKR
jgi:hypothetical protein